MTIRVSDHAVLQYLQRRYGFDLEKVRAELLTPGVIAAALLPRETHIQAHGGRIVVKDGTVVTFLPRTGLKRKKQNARTWPGAIRCIEGETI